MAKEETKIPIAFRDGKCTVFTANQHSLDKKLGEFDFKEETLGVRAFYELNVIGRQIERAISIPFNKLVDFSSVIGIEDKYYKVVLLQHKDTFPKSIRITLEYTPLRWKDDKVQ